MKIGGYFSLECNRRECIHSDGLLLNSGCSALRLAIRHRKLTELYVPEFTCPTVWEAVRREGCECLFYTVGEDFLPTKKLPSNAYIVYNNYFGICARQVEAMAEDYPHLIVDNAQAFYMPMRGRVSIYSLRKFFGLPDGGILLDEEKIDAPQRRSCSYERCSHLLKRWDLEPEDGYTDFLSAEAAIKAEEPLRISRLTEAMLGNCDDEFARKRRLENFTFLHQHLEESNLLTLSLSDMDVPLVYPYLTKKSDLRQSLIRQKIFVANYWPNIKENCFSNLVALPINQYCSLPEMQKILECLKNE